MANIKLNLPGVPFTGQIVTFSAPCGCDEVTDGLSINGEIYTIVDAMGKCATGICGRWVAGSMVSVTLDVTNHKAYLQNEARGVSAETAELLGLPAGAAVDVALVALKSAINSNAEAIAKGVKFAAGHYTGTGELTKSLTFEFVPKFVLVYTANRTGGTDLTTLGFYPAYDRGSDCMLGLGSNMSEHYMAATLSGTTLSWTDDDSVDTAFNDAGDPYNYIAIG